ncbi:FAD-binding oxidoreductase [Paenibacillus sp. XY044]|uniref:NAD(P)/FAD-dependent oxidoreductase n=1 Tax=Paenibacillus sp. XY044 TaxID=2026089 RepID=UPI000B995D38|nr:FAD-dependent oxidoreductase [Paenibacillus sp. XY044]OZB96347.1 amino acid oxidase [Paenibacillus sp. XY044]
MILNKGNLAWPSTLNPAPAYPELAEDLSCDVLVIGGGMGGALLVHKLSGLNLQTVLLEKGRIAGGSTSANTGLLQSFNDKSLTSIIHTFGEQTGIAFYQMCKEAMRKLKEAAAGLKLEPELIPRNSLYYASSEEDVPNLKAEYETLRKHGFETLYWDQADIAARFPFSKSAALYTAGDAEVNPFRFVHALVQYAADQGVQVYENSPVVHLEYEEDGVVCYTRTGRIFARKVVHASGYETQEEKPDRNALLQTTYAIVTSPVSDFTGWHERCLIWESARPYLYMRTTPDNRIVAGGLDEHPVAPEEREGRIRHKSELLLNEIKSLFPRYAGIKADYAWASLFGITHDGLPMIGPHSRYPHSYFIEAYGGNGTVYCMIAAELLGDVLNGKTRSELELFALERTSKPSPEAQVPGN